MPPASDALDAIDLRLLALLQEDAARPVAVISEIVGLSTPSCYRRLRRLRTEGFIRREAAVVSRRALGWPLLMTVLVKLEIERPQALDALQRALRRTPEVIEAFYVTGDYDFILKVVARDMGDFEELMSSLLYGSGIVKTYKTLVVMKEVKELGPIPISEASRG
jgi:Lrp/AsnC family leucine-responsive transcriptional regulator